MTGRVAFSAAGRGARGAPTWSREWGSSSIISSVFPTERAWCTASFTPAVSRTIAASSSSAGVSAFVYTSDTCPRRRRRQLSRAPNDRQG